MEINKGHCEILCQCCQNCCMILFEAANWAFHIWRPVEPVVIHGSSWSLNAKNDIIIWLMNIQIKMYSLGKLFIKELIFWPTGKYGKQDGFGSIEFWWSKNPWWLSPSGVTIDWTTVNNALHFVICLTGNGGNGGHSSAFESSETWDSVLPRRWFQSWNVLVPTLRSVTTGPRLTNSISVGSFNDCCIWLATQK